MKPGLFIGLNKSNWRSETYLKEQIPKIGNIILKCLNVLFAHLETNVYVILYNDIAT